MTYSRYLLRTAVFSIFGILSCTNFGFTELQDRINDNFNMGLLAPTDIDPAGTDSFTFAMLGDTHIGSPSGEVMKQMVKQAHANGDAFVVVAGDLTAGGLDGEFSQFKEIFNAEGIEYRAAIGNHDVFFGGWSRYRVQIGRSVYSFNADNVHIIVLDSANGLLGEQQLAWLEQDLALNTKTHTIIVTHFPPWNGYFSSIYKMSSEEEAAVLKDIAYRYGVKYIFSGHFHGYEEIEFGGVKYVVTGGANDVLDLGQRKNYVRVRVNGSSISTELIYF